MPAKTLAEILAEAERLEREACRYCGHADIDHAIVGRTVGCQAGDGSEANPICGCRKLRGELTHEMGDTRAPHPDPDTVSFWLAYGPRLVAVARAAEKMRETYGKLSSLHSVTSGVPTFDVDEHGEVVETGRTPDVDNPDCEHCRVLRAFDAVASGGEEKPNE